MKLKIDQSFRLFLLMSQSGNLDDWRRHYVARKESGRCMIIVCRNGLELWKLSDQVVHARVGWKRGGVGHVQERNVGLQHTKLTIFRVLPGGYKLTLGQVLKNAPKVDD